MPPPFRRRTTKKEPRRSPRSAVVRCRGLERGPCRQLSRAGAGRRRCPRDQRRDPRWSRRGHRDAVRASGEADALGYETQARLLWQQARAGYPDDVWVYVQAGIGYGDIGDHAGALEWLTTGLELAQRTGGPESALEQLRRCARPACPRSGARPTKFSSERPRANRGTQVSDKRSALDALSAAEKAAVLDELLAARPAGQPPMPRFGTPRGTSLPPASATTVSYGRQAWRA